MAVTPDLPGFGQPLPPPLFAGDKTGQWHTWYAHAIPQAEQQYEVHLQERAKAEEEGRD